jgi:hypothetical protein
VICINKRICYLSISLFATTGLGYDFIGLLRGGNVHFNPPYLFSFKMLLKLIRLWNVLDIALMGT